MTRLGHVLFIVLVSLIIHGCAVQPAQEIRAEFTRQFETVPLPPSATEVGRQFEIEGNNLHLVVTFSIPEYQFKDLAYRESFGDGVWHYKTSQAERDGHYYTKDEWTLYIRQEPGPKQVHMALSKH